VDNEARRAEFFDNCGQRTASQSGTAQMVSLPEGMALLKRIRFATTFAIFLFFWQK
jgi:transketolase C-terminal domain/subunit